MAVTTGRFVGDPRGFLSPNLHRQRIATLPHDRIDAPCVLDGPVNSESFKTPISSSSSCRRSSPARLSSWPISAATRALRCAGPFAPWARGFSSCRPTVLTSNLSGACQAENAAPKGPPSELSKYPGSASQPVQLLHTTGVHQPDPKRRICCHLNEECF